MPNDAGPPLDEDLLELLIRDVLSRYEPERGALTLQDLTDTVGRCGTLLEGVDDPVYVVSVGQVRDRLRSMQDVCVSEGNTPRARFDRKAR